MHSSMRFAALSSGFSLAVTSMEKGEKKNSPVTPDARESRREREENNVCAKRSTVAQMYFAARGFPGNLISWILS